MELMLAEALLGAVERPLLKIQLVTCVQSRLIGTYPVLYVVLNRS